MVLEFVEICVFVVVYSFRFCLSFFWAGGGRVFVEFSLNFFSWGFACEEMEEIVGDLC